MFHAILYAAPDARGVVYVGEETQSDLLEN